MTEEAVTEQDFRGSAPVMTSKDLLLELRADMKVVRPVVEELQRANVVARLHALELDHARRDAAGADPVHVVARVASLEGWRQDINSAGVERRRLAGITNKTLAAIVLISNFILGLVVFILNVTNP